MDTKTKKFNVSLFFNLFFATLQYETRKYIQQGSRLGARSVVFHFARCVFIVLPN